MTTRSFQHVLLIGLLLPLLTGCGRVDTAAAPRAGIVTMAPHLTETLFALGQGGRVVGVSSFCDYPPEVAALPKAGGYIDPDLEKITALAPELLIVPGEHDTVTEYAAMRHLPVLNVNMDSLESIDAGIATIGKALSCEEAAGALRAGIKGDLEAVRAAVSGLPRPKVLLITMRQDHDLNTLYTANASSFVSELVECAGGDNVYADSGNTYLEASKETIVMKAPDVIIEFHAGEALSPEEQAQYVNDWQQLPMLPAVKNGRVYLVLESHALRPGPRVAEIARILARLLHPDAELPAR